MTAKRKLIRLLDRPGLRGLLSTLATAYARQKSQLDTQLFYDHAWVRRIDQVYLAEFSTFDWNLGQAATWKPGHADTLDMHRDWWFTHYQPKPGHTILDIGAGIGEDTLLFSKTVGPTGRVLSVEAHPLTFELLKKTCAYNHLQNVTPVLQAIMDKPGSVSIENRAGHQANTITTTNNNSATPAAFTIPGDTLDTLCRQHKIDHIDFLKMNIEGAEQLAIRGMTEMIQRTNALCIACHDFLAHESAFYKTRAIVAEYLKTQGFKIYTSDHRPEPWARDHLHALRA